MTAFITGGTGYMGRALITELLRRGHRVRALVRSGSESKLPAGCELVIGDALDATSYADRVRPAECFVHLVGVSHPSPAKAQEFRTVDLASVRNAVSAAASVMMEHFVYVSVAHPAPVMKAYVEVRMQAESLIAAAGLNATIVRPWYVLGPGHWWPILLLPAYWVLERIPRTREGARRLGLVTLKQMVMTLAEAVENPCRGLRVIEAPEIGKAGKVAASGST